MSVTIKTIAIQKMHHHLLLARFFCCQLSQWLTYVAFNSSTALAPNDIADFPQ